MIYILTAFLAFSSASAQDRSQTADTLQVSTEDYRIYRSDGAVATEANLREALQDIDVVFIGELHNDPVSHHIEQMVFENMFELHGHASTLSMEMFGRDVQYIVDEYLDDLISESHFRRSSSPWKNYETDYRQLVEFAKESGLDVIAANAPRRYANRVTREGRSALEDLSDHALSFLAPLPYGAASAAYKKQWDRVMEEAMAEMMAAMRSAEPDSAEAAEEPEAVAKEAEADEAADTSEGGSTHGTGSMLDAQSLWDATMAWSIAEHLTRIPGSKITHMVGGFHVDTGTGIPEHLSQYRPGTRMLIISTQSVEDIHTFDPEVHTGLGDFIVLGDSSLPRTYDESER